MRVLGALLLVAAAGGVAACGCAGEADQVLGSGYLPLCEPLQGSITFRDTEGTPGTPRDRGRDMVLDHTFRVITVGTTSLSDGRGAAAVTRYIRGGDHDLDFGAGGRTRISPTHIDAGFEPYAVDVDPQDRIVMGGNSAVRDAQGGATNHAAVARTLLDGSLDPSFGTQGFVLFDQPGYRGVSGKGVAVDIEGRIVLATHWRSIADTSRWDVHLYRLLDNGDLDATFGTNGIAVLPRFSPTGTATFTHAVIVDSADRIVVSTTERQDDGSQIQQLVRLDSTGAIDPFFGAMGVHRYRTVAAGTPGIANSSDAMWDVVEDNAGNYLVAGAARVGNSWDMGVWRILADGAADLSFGNAGLVTAVGHDVPDTDDFGRGIALTRAGGIYVAGSSRSASGDLDLVVWAFHNDGTPDASFAAGTHKLFDHDTAGGNGDERAVTATYNPADCMLYVHGSSWAGDTEREDIASWQIR